MRLTDLRPKFYCDGEGRRGLGLTFDCPCCVASGTPYRLVVAFANPLDGGEPDPAKTHWLRTGETPETLSLEPSVDASAHGHWHGWVRNGEAT